MESLDEVRPLLMVSNSEIETFKRCRRKWNLASFNRRNLVPKLPNLKFWIGTACHYALERFHGHGEDPIVAYTRWVDEQKAGFREYKRLPPKFWETLDETITLGRYILRHYVRYTAQRPEYQFRYIATEYEFSVPIPGHQIWLHDATGMLQDWVVEEWGKNPFEHEQFRTLYVDRGLVTDQGMGFYTIPPLYVGRLDGLIEDENGHIRVIDHKFMASLVDPEMLTIDTQTARYVWAAKISIDNGWWPEVPQGTEVRGALYNVVRKKRPRIPEILKNGTTSKNKSIDTTYEMFKAALIEREEDPKDFVEVLTHLRDVKGNTFFQLTPIERGPRELQLMGAKLQYEYEDMNRVAMVSRDVAHPALYPSPTKDCSWQCPFKRICYVANWGGDVEHIVREEMVSQVRTDLYASQVEYNDIDPADGGGF